MRLHKKGFSNEIVFGLSGMTFRYGILEASAEEILAQLCDSANDAKKASQVKSSASAKKYVYRAGLNNRKIANSNRLLEAIYIMSQGTGKRL